MTRLRVLYHNVGGKNRHLLHILLGHKIQSTLIPEHTVPLMNIHTT